MKGNNLVSVILSVYNGEETIGKAINSILNQTYKELEILIVDDNSTDNTHEILLDYEKMFNSMLID